MVGQLLLCQKAMCRYSLGHEPDGIPGKQVGIEQGVVIPVAENKGKQADTANEE